MDWRSEFARLEWACAARTIRPYYADVQVYVDWCEANGIAAFPGDVASICAFLEAQGSECAASAVRRRLYAIRKAHRLLRLPDPTRDGEINLALRRVRRTTLSRPKQALGCTRSYRDRFIESEPDTPWGLRHRAMLSLGYDLLTRRSELVTLTLDDIDFRGEGTLKVLIRRSKSDPFGHGRIGFTSRRTAEHVARWFDWRGHAIRPLFCPIYQHVAIDRALSTTTVKRVIKNAALRVWLGPQEARASSGHSLRVDAAQDLLSMGHDTIAIMRAGGWKSVAVLARYLEHADHTVWE